MQHNPTRNLAKRRQIGLLSCEISICRGPWAMGRRRSCKTHRLCLSGGSPAGSCSRASGVQLPQCHLPGDCPRCAARSTGLLFFPISVSPPPSPKIHAKAPSCQGQVGFQYLSTRLTEYSALNLQRHGTFASRRIFCCVVYIQHFFTAVSC